MRNVMSLVAVAAVVTLLAGAALADMVVLREGLDGYSGTSDIFIARSPSTTNTTTIPYAGRQAIDIWGSPFPPNYATTMGQSASGAGDGNNWKEGLLKFDNLFDSLPPLVVIESATLSLEIVNSYEKAEMWRVVTPWTEATASWDLFDGDGIGSDVSDHPMDGGGVTTGINTLAAPDFTSATGISTGPLDIDVTAAVQAWYADPSSNEGWVFYNDNMNRGMFVSIEDTVDVTDRPTLTIEYTVVPEPATMLLLAAGAVPLLRRRRA